MKRFILALLLAGMILRSDLAATSAEQAKDPPTPAPLKDRPATVRGETARPGGQEVPRRPKTTRALIEEAVLLSASTIDYWRAYNKFTADWRFTFGYRLTGTPLELGLAAEGISRAGRLPGVSDHYRELNFFYQARLVF